MRDTQCLHRRDDLSERRAKGFSLIEVIVAFAILATLSTLALPTAFSRIRRSRERTLMANLEEMRRAIDRYKDMADANLLSPQQAGSDNYPPSLQSLVDGVPLANGAKFRFLRRIPVDPFTGSTDWGIHSTQDDPKSQSWGGQNAFDVFTKSEALDGTGHRYSDW